jgi:hypothetical protein
MIYRELPKLIAALLKATADGNEASERAAQAALDTARKTLHEQIAVGGIIKVRAMAERSAAAARNDNS